MEGWIPIPNADVNLAAIMATLGVQPKIETSNDVRSGKAWCNISLPAAQIPKLPMPAARGSGKRMIQRGIVHIIREGQLEKYHPNHDANYGVTALYNREKILDWLKQGGSYCLKTTPYRYRAFYVSGEPENAVKMAAEQFPTDNIKLVAALGVIGVPICRIEGTEHHHTFYVARWSYNMGDGPKDAHAMSRDLFKLASSPKDVERVGSVSRDCPLYWAWQTLCNRERILDIIHKKEPKLLVRKSGSNKFTSAIITPTGVKKIDDKQFNSALKQCGQY